MSDAVKPDLKAMYRTMVKDAFPDTLTITLGDTVLTYARRTWKSAARSRDCATGKTRISLPRSMRSRTAACSWADATGAARGGIVSALTEAQMRQSGKHPGKTNLTDVDNGVNILQYLTERPAAVILKHNNPCGAAWSREGLADALNKAFRCDRIAAFGGAVVVNRPLDLATAEIIASSYFEVVAAPAFEPGAFEKISTRKNLRVFELPALAHLERWPANRSWTSNALPTEDLSCSSPLSTASARWTTSCRPKPPATASPWWPDAPAPTKWTTCCLPGRWKPA